jgi:hypothetical protein
VLVLLCWVLLAKCIGKGGGGASGPISCADLLVLAAKVATQAAWKEVKVGVITFVWEWKGGRGVVSVCETRVLQMGVLWGNAEGTGKVATQAAWKEVKVGVRGGGCWAFERAKDWLPKPHEAKACPYNVVCHTVRWFLGAKGGAALAPSAVLTCWCWRQRWPHRQHGKRSRCAYDASHPCRHAWFFWGVVICA